MDENKNEEILSIRNELKKLLSLYEVDHKHNKIIIIIGIISILIMVYSFVTLITQKHYIITVIECIYLISTTISVNKIFNIHIKKKKI